MTRFRIHLVIACFAVVASLLVAATASAAVSDYGLESASAELSTTQAGAHPDLIQRFAIKTDPTTPEDGDGDHEPYAHTQDVRISLPAGLIGNPDNVATCSSQAFATAFFSELSGEPGCPLGSQVGVVTFQAYHLETPTTEAVYNLEAPGGENVARLGFWGFSVPIYINVRVRSESDYGLTAELKSISATFPLTKATTTLWGVPGASIHNEERITPLEAVNGVTSSPPRASGLAPLPFMTNPTSCTGPQTMSFASDSYAEPDRFSVIDAPLEAITGCETVPFEPQITFTPSTTEAESPSGLAVDLTLPQPGQERPNVPATANLREAVVRLPAGMTLNPAAANGLAACSPTQIGLVTSSPISFDSALPSCPEASKVGTAEVDTPLLPEPLKGALYLGQQGNNPFHSLLAGYLFAEGKGIRLKLAGKFDLEPGSGRITATFAGNPQQPFSQLRLRFKSGQSGVLITPPGCGQYVVETSLTPWSSSSATQLSSSFPVDRGPGGGACPSGAFAPTMRAGTTNPTAGSYSPFSFDLSRQDGTQRFGSLSVQLPKGLLGKLAGIPYCPDAALAAIPTAEGTGAAQIAAPGCSTASQIGTVSVAVGAGSLPLTVDTGRAYLAGPYEGAPLSLAIVTPAVAGPFDLGNVVVRAALRVDPQTAQITAVSDPLPTILDGIPLDIKSIHLEVNRPEFSLNPTSCDPEQFAGQVVSEAGRTATVSSRFQVGSCERLDFEPALKLSFSGQTKRTGFPAVRAVLTQPKGRNANLAGTTVLLPKGMLIANAHINNPCTRVQFNSTPSPGEGCPAKSVLGSAKVWTPLLEKPEQGKVYFRSNGGERQLPDLVIALRGQIPLQLVGFIDSVGKKGAEVRRVRTRFLNLPDAPVSRFELKLAGGKKGLLQNSKNLCRAKYRATLNLSGQNAKTHDTEPAVQVSCGGKKK